MVACAVNTTTQVTLFKPFIPVCLYINPLTCIIYSTDIVFAQFRTSTVKDVLSPDQPASSGSRTTAAAITVAPQQKDRLGATSPQRTITTVIKEQQQALASTAVLSPLQKLKQKQQGGLTVSSMDVKPLQSAAVVDIHRPGNPLCSIFPTNMFSNHIYCFRFSIL